MRATLALNGLNVLTLTSLSMKKKVDKKSRLKLFNMVFYGSAYLEKHIEYIAPKNVVKTL